MLLQYRIHQKVAYSSNCYEGIRCSLREGWTLLKTSFSCQCANKAETASHCICHALYNPTDPDFQGKRCQKHLKIQVNCMELLTALENITEANKQMIFSEEKEELTYNISWSVETVLSWIAHLIRGVKQNEAKQYAMSMLDEITGLWLSDWTQKIIPVSLREGQNEYFGMYNVLGNWCFVYKKILKIFYEKGLPYYNVLVWSGCTGYIVCESACSNTNKDRLTKLEILAPEKW